VCGDYDNLDHWRSRAKDQGTERCALPALTSVPTEPRESKRDLASMAQHLTQSQSRCDGCAQTAYLVGTPYGLWCGRCWRLWVRAEPQSRAFPIEFGRHGRIAALAQGAQAIRASRVADLIAAAHARQVALDRVRARVSADSREEPEPEPEPKRRRYVTDMHGHRRLE
jgi:hypothetical protein